jgi:hypothetical protein
MTVNQLQNIGQLIQQLSNIESGFDFRVDPATLLMNFYYRQVKSGYSIYGRGQDRANAVFSYGKNLTTLSRTTDPSKLTTQMTVIGQYGQAQWPPPASGQYPSAGASSQLIVGATQTNLVPDPSFEYDPINGNSPTWAITGSGTVTTFAVQSGWAAAGSQSSRLTVTGLPASGKETILSGLIPVTAGLYYSAQASYNVLTPNTTPQLQIYWYNSTPTLLSTSTVSGSAIAGVQTLQDLAQLAPASAAYCQVVCSWVNATGGTIAADGYMDAIMLIAGSTLPQYFDGDSTGGVWNGVAGDSTSTVTLPANPAIATYGLWEATASLSNIVSSVITEAYATEEVLFLDSPLVIYTMSPVQYHEAAESGASVPQPFQDYDIGDFVYLAANYGRMQVPAAGWGGSGYYPVRLNIDNEGNERVSDMQTVYTTSS